MDIDVTSKLSTAVALLVTSDIQASYKSRHNQEEQHHQLQQRHQEKYHEESISCSSTARDAGAAARLGAAVILHALSATRALRQSGSEDYQRTKKTATLQVSGGGGDVGGDGVAIDKLLETGRTDGRLRQVHAVLGESDFIARSCGFETASDLLTPFIKLDLDEIAVCFLDTSAAFSDRACHSRGWSVTAAWKQHASSYEASVRVPVPFFASIPQPRLDALRFLARGFVKLVYEAAADPTAAAVQIRRAVIETRSLTVKDVEKQGGDGAAVTGSDNVLSSVMAGVLDLLRDPGVAILDLIRLMKTAIEAG
jgi:hypothetical protein